MLTSRWLIRHFDYNDLFKNYRNPYRQMYFSSSNFTKIRFRLGLCPGPPWGSLRPPSRLGRGTPSPRSPPPRRLRRLDLGGFGASLPSEVRRQRCEVRTAHQMVNPALYILEFCSLTSCNTMLTAGDVGIKKMISASEGIRVYANIFLWHVAEIR